MNSPMEDFARRYPLSLGVAIARYESLLHRVASPYLPVKANIPTQLKNPERKELKGKVPTSAQYRNWSTPVATMKARKRSTILVCVLAAFLYSASRLLPTPLMSKADAAGVMSSETTEISITGWFYRE